MKYGVLIEGKQKNEKAKYYGISGPYDTIDSCLVCKINEDSASKKIFVIGQFDHEERLGYFDAEVLYKWENNQWVKQ